MDEDVSTAVNPVAGQALLSRLRQMLPCGLKALQALCVAYI